MRILLVIAMALLLSGCGSIISRTVPGEGHGNQYYPACSGMCVIRHGDTSPFSICLFRWCSIRCCCRLMPATVRTTNQRSSHSSAAV